MAKKKGKNKGKGSAKNTPKNTPKKGTPHRTPSRFQPWPQEEGTLLHLSAALPAQFADYVAVEKPRYSLADEARFVLGHRKNAFEAGKKLRNMPVEFVSAGMLEGTIKDKEQQEMKAAVPDSGSESDDESIAPSTSSSMSPPDNTRAMAQMAIRSPSPALSEASSGSSDEVIFQGRGNSSAPLSMTTSRVESPLPQKQVNAVAEAVNNAVDVANAKAEAVSAQVAAAASVPVEDVQVQPNINVSIRVKGIVTLSCVPEAPH